MTDRAHTSKNWFALFTASNNEKKVEKHLQRLEIETFLPLYVATRRWKNRTTVKVELPLFSGYVFARFARTESARVLEVPMVYSVVGNKMGALALPEEEIEALRQGLRSADIEPHPYLKVGQRARIKSGPLARLAGIVTRVDGALRVVINVESITRSIAVRVNAEDLEFLAEQPGDEGSVGVDRPARNVGQA
jgi:transcription antitermination factor NusG